MLHQPGEFSARASIGARGRIVGELFEGDVLVASFSRAAASGWRFDIRWRSERAALRFDDFCDCLGRSETLEALCIPLT